jgi:uncharacterized membrane protein YhaH (DUF805 family)/type II secretory pathway pseudopilin PulG
MEANPYGAPRSVIDEAPATQPVKVFSISGRIGRIRYIAWGIGLILLIGIVGIILAAVAGPAGEVVLILMWVAITAIGLMLTIQRCHDFNVTGWLALLYFIPLANLAFWFIPGTDGPNRFGNPTPPNSTVAIVLVSLAAVGIPVVGILAAVAIPAYSDYTHRARVSEVILTASSWRTAVTEHHARTGKLPATVAELKDAELSKSGRYGSVSLGAEGVLTLTFSSETGPMAGKTMLLQPKLAGNALSGWDCTGGTLEPKYRQASCRRQ